MAQHALHGRVNENEQTHSILRSMKFATQVIYAQMYPTYTEFHFFLEVLGILDDSFIRFDTL